MKMLRKVKIEYFKSIVDSDITLKTLGQGA